MNGMADEKKSRGVENVDLSKIDGMGNGQKPKGCGNKSCYCVRIADDDGKPSDMTIRITADVGDALTGFKALQRELRETTKAARELEQAYKDADKAVNSDKAVYPTTFDLQTSALKRAVEESNQIPDELRKDILAKFAEDEAKIAELERKLNDLSEVSTKELHEELAKRTGVKEYAVNLGGTAKICVDNDGEGLTETFGGPARIIVNRD